MAEFKVGGKYTRADIQAHLGLEPKKGGNWDTGYHRHNGEWFLFPNIGVPGSTGHDYDNRWIHDELHWYGKTHSKLDQPAIQSMLTPGARVHLFTRTKIRDPFTYHGLVTHTRTIDAMPVEIVWRLGPQRDYAEQPLPEELPKTYPEAALRTITVNAYERNPAARRACIARWGTVCGACGMDLGKLYGPVADGYIHVHHLDPMASAEGPRFVDPVRDLRPVCPNCHGVIHLQDPPLSLEQVTQMLDAARRSNPRSQ